MSELEELRDRVKALEAFALQVGEIMKEMLADDEDESPYGDSERWRRAHLAARARRERERRE